MLQLQSFDNVDSGDSADDADNADCSINWTVVTVLEVASKKLPYFAAEQ